MSRGGDSLRDAMVAASQGWPRAQWDGNINTPHTMQDEYELQQRLGASALTTDAFGQMVAVEDAEPDCPACGDPFGNPSCDGVTR